MPFLLFIYFYFLDGDCNICVWRCGGGILKLFFAVLFRQVSRHRVYLDLLPFEKLWLYHLILLAPDKHTHIGQRERENKKKLFYALFMK